MIAFQLFCKGTMPWTNALQKDVELRAVVQILQMAEFVKDNVIP